jgi:Mg/Co/Ni transporter MgtE
LTITGRPMARTTSSASATSPITPSEPGVTGTPAAVMVVRAMALSPISSIDSGPGPMKVMPLAAHRREKAAFSARKP